MKWSTGKVVAYVLYLGIVLGALSAIHRAISSRPTNPVKGAAYYETILSSQRFSPEILDQIVSYDEKNAAYSIESVGSCVVHCQNAELVIKNAGRITFVGNSGDGQNLAPLNLLEPRPFLRISLRLNWYTVVIIEHHKSSAFITAYARAHKPGSPWEMVMARTKVKN